MQFLILSLAAMAAAGTIPAMLKERAPLTVCPALDTPLCCQLDVDGVLDLTCEAREFPPPYVLLLPSSVTDCELSRGTILIRNHLADDTSSVSAFEKSCADTGSAAKCCTLPLAGDALLCGDP
ncbi:Putative cerato-ulmin hydrophobin family, Hydrophobin superfamily [Septoria linicola]|uniref:Cerato-ulmin hydrophobin family, Hydrophobin superfamily n=1 Tax=Septoria linicola TaxID=215465 RepID=A0A9Q9ASR0_9PEZI|nr:Putative cerato-ulmin hydrophobin family, Hydrophobin superfamily [Septoria linicola]